MKYFALETYPSHLSFWIWCGCSSETSQPEIRFVPLKEKKRRKKTDQWKWIGKKRAQRNNHWKHIAVLDVMRGMCSSVERRKKKYGWIVLKYVFTTCTISVSNRLTNTSNYSSAKKKKKSSRFTKFVVTKRTIIRRDTKRNSTKVNSINV